MERSRLMKDIDYAGALDELGFCVAPLFTLEQVDTLKRLYSEFTVENKVSGLIASHSKIGPEKNLLLCKAIREALWPSLENWFTDFDFFIGGFMVKEAHAKSELPLHQDWNVLDETQYSSCQIWIPVDLSSPANGGMYVLPYSHRFFNNYRSGSYGIPTIHMDESLREVITDMIIPPGSALVFHNSLFHASYPNNSDQNRISVIVNVYQKNAPLSYFHKNAIDNCTDIYPINSEIFLTTLNTLENGGVPETGGKVSVALNETDNRKITSADLMQKLGDVLKGREKYFEPRQLYIVKDKAIENKLQRHGFAVLDFLEPETVSLLKDAYEKQFNTANTSIGRFTPMEHSSPSTKRDIHNFILDAIRCKLDTYFDNYQTPIASYFTKYARSKGDLSWHTDASIMLNTNLEPHLGIWCPLIDVNENNGAFCLIPGSHKFSHVVFLPGLPWPYYRFSNMFDEARMVLELKAGQMVLFDLRLIHHATPNNTDEDRIAFCVRLTSTKSNYYSFSCSSQKDENVLVFEEQPDYYLRDDWSGDNQAANRHRKAGEMQHIYARINYTSIKKALEALAQKMPVAV